MSGAANAPDTLHDEPAHLYTLDDFSPQLWFHSSRKPFFASADDYDYVHVGTRRAAIDRYTATIGERGDTGATLYHLQVVDPSPLRSQLNDVLRGEDPMWCIDGDATLPDYGLTEWGFDGTQSSFYINHAEDPGSLSLYAPIHIFRVVATEDIAPIGHQLSS